MWSKFTTWLTVVQRQDKSGRAFGARFLLFESLSAERVVPSDGLKNPRRGTGLLECGSEGSPTGLIYEVRLYG
jgi:hypothetical protein